ncbi:hypothetical protein DFQ27_005670 [Actinomortierella ambigua]|uniref:Pentatricopeptide repeat-containing protein n=1 Tax=Actinomortierella ambigua TaxID=1343610 RepID=A0A9P6U1K7_9FUNG|nr:hypothetical protein DFQ27_005670 [Actinomortierella ambigua]
MTKIPVFVQAILRAYLPRRLASASRSEDAAYRKLLQAAASSSSTTSTRTADTAFTSTNPVATAAAKRAMSRSTPQQWQPCAAFSTSPCQTMSNKNTYTKEEEDLYQVLISSFRERLAEQPHQPENYYNAVIQQLVSHNKNTHPPHHHSASKARRDRISMAAQHHDLTLLQREQDEMRMENNDLAADHLCLIQGWLKCGELKRATLAFEMMESMGVFPTVRILSVLIRAHTRAHNMEAAKSMMHRMTDMNLQPSSIYDMSALLEYHIKLAPTLVTGTTVSSGTPGTVSIHNTMVDSSNHSSHTSSMETNHVDAVWKAIEARISKDMTPSEAKNAAFSYRTYLVYLVMKKRDLDTAALLIDRMALQDLWPGVERYRKTAGNVIQRLLEHGFLSETRTLLLGKEATLGRVVDDHVWAQLMEAYLARGEPRQARSVYDEMVRARITPSERCQRLLKQIANAAASAASSSSSPVGGGDGGAGVARFLSIHDTRPVLV